MLRKPLLQSLRPYSSYYNENKNAKSMAIAKRTKTLLSSSKAKQSSIIYTYNMISPQTLHPSTIKSRHYSRMSHVTRSFSSHRKDPTAKRPTSVCDPYGQGGKALEYQEVSLLLQTLDEGWIIERSESSKASTSELPLEERPLSIYKEFYHCDFLAGSKFVSQMAAVGHNNNHFPHLTLERRLMKKEKAWKVVTTVKCMTPPLNGLSYNDFHIAMLIDVETGRDEIKQLMKDELKKSI